MSWLTTAVHKICHPGRGKSSGSRSHRVTESPIESPQPALVSPTSEESLEDRLCKTMTVSNYPDRSDEYFPERTYELLTPEAIRRHWEGESAVDHSLLQFIVEDGKRLFTLVLTTNTGSKDRQVKLMRCFQKHRISDSSLSPEIKLGRRTNPWLQPDQLRSLDENVWSFNVASTVCRQQWQVLTPVFSIEKASHDLSSQAILPFEKVKGKVPAQGAFGIVHEVKIQEGHFLGETITGGTSGKYEWPATFAVKEIKTNEQVRDELEETFTNEARHLQMMNSHYSDHIVRFVTAFTTMGGDDIGTRKYYLVFEWADGGNLQDLFKQHPNPTLSKHLIKSVVKQIHGLASALQLTHEKAMIRHGDLKPGNILRFKKSPPGSSSPVSGDGGEEDEEDIIGTLKIGDWGLAKYHAVATELRGNATKTVHGTAMYEPPEVDPDLHLGVGDNKRLGRSYDTWSMGCIILEIIIWLIYGYDGVVDFESDVRSHKATVSIPCYVVEVVKGSDPPRYQAKVRPIVNSWINHLLKEELCGANQALGQLLRIVQQDLLVVDLPRVARPGTIGLGSDISPEPTPQERNNPHDLDTDGIPGIRITRTATFRTGDLYSANTTTTTATRATSTQLVGKLRNVMDSQGSNPHSDWWYQPRARVPSKPNFAPSYSQDKQGNLLPNVNRKQTQMTKAGEQTLVSRPIALAPQPPNEPSASQPVRLSAPGAGNLGVSSADGHLSPRPANIIVRDPPSLKDNALQADYMESGS